jgi:hypothetical protein
MNRLLPTLGLLILAQPAFAQTVTETDFVLTITNADGSKVEESTTLIPMLAGACYNWWLRLSKSKGDVEVVEVFTLPSAPASWGSVNDTTTISEDMLTATSTMSLTPDENGWIGHGWCVAEGDPTGDHRIVVKAGDRVLGEFPFQIENM